MLKRQMKGFGAMISFEHPASMTHAGMSPEDRRAAGISDGLVRYSVGIEDVEALIGDLRRALDAVSPSGGTPKDAGTTVAEPVAR
ncbi:MAG: PLP-dependent transferase [Terriglobales bacterium]